MHKPHTPQCRSQFQSQRGHKPLTPRLSNLPSTLSELNSFPCQRLFALCPRPVLRPGCEGGRRRGTREVRAFEASKHQASRWTFLAGCPGFFFFSNIFFFFFLRERKSTSRGGAEREGDTESEAAPGSEPSAQSPTRGSNSQTARS